MTEQIIEGIFRIPVSLPDNPLKELNAYFLRGKERDLLIDTGFRCDTCREFLKKGLKEVGGDIRRLDVLATHVHSDHMGLVREFAAADGTIYVSERDYAELERHLDGSSERDRHLRYLIEGFPLERLKEVEECNPAAIMETDGIDRRFRTVKDGDLIQVGDFSLTVIEVPGHTPGNVMLWMEKQKILFSGDHVLFDITPNIIFCAGVEDALGDYLGSLEKADRYPVKAVLPGHRGSGDYHSRIRELICHHKARLNEVERIVENHQGLTAYEIAGEMTWRIRARDWASFPLIQQWFAVGECIAHVDYLLKRGRLLCRVEGDRRRYYRAAAN